MNNTDNNTQSLKKLTIEDFCSAGQEVIKPSSSETINIIKTVSHEILCKQKQ